MLWLSFAICVFLAILVLYLPGFLLLKSFRFSHIVSFAAAPAITVPSYALICILLSILGISATGQLVFGLLFLIGLLCFSALCIPKKFRSSALISSPSANKKYWLILLLYIALGVLIGTFFFVRSLDTPASFFQDYDNVFHLNLVQSFLSSGDWSSLHASVYTASEFYSDKTPRLEWGSFYPAAWHCLNAIIASISAYPLTIVQNSLLFVFSFIVFPIGIFLFLKTLYKNNYSLLLYGSLATFAFALFPWGILISAPLYPNLIAFCLVPISLSIFLKLFDLYPSNKIRVFHAVLFVYILLGYALIQANAVFTIALFFIPFILQQCYKITNKMTCSSRKAFLATVIAFLVVSLIWIACYKAPFMRSVVAFNWNSWLDLSEALYNTAVLAMGDFPSPQPLVAFIVFIGVLYTCSNRKYLWLSISYILVLLIYIICASYDGSLKQLLAGFWYTDSNRIAAMAVYSGIPIFSMGISAIIAFIKATINSILEALDSPSFSSNAIKFTSCLVFFVLIFFPFYPKEDSFHDATAFGNIQNRLISINSQNKIDLLDKSERNFLLKVKTIVGTEDLIINSPGDGSLFAYPLFGLNTYYRAVSNFTNTTSYSGTGETEASYYIRTSLKTISDNQSVKDAVESTGAKYVLILGSENREVRTYNSLSYDSSDWDGIDTITNETPGFTMILEEDGMKLFSINDQN